METGARLEADHAGLMRELREGPTEAQTALLFRRVSDYLSRS
jgi:hypothetical protein